MINIEINFISDENFFIHLLTLSSLPIFDNDCHI